MSDNSLIVKGKIDPIWQCFYNENMAQTSDIVNQLTTLMFIKMLDDKQNNKEANALLIGAKLKEEDKIFKSGNYKNYEMINGEKILKFEIPYEELRWKNFKNLNAIDLANRLKGYVLPFIKDPENEAIGQFRKYAQRYTYGFDGKERLLQQVVDKLSDPFFDFTKSDVMGDTYEYMCGSGISGQYRTPRHIINMAVNMMKPKLGEKIIDPAMGTAGFLISAANYMTENQRSDLKNKDNKAFFNNNTFYGCDTDTNMSRIGYMNLVLHSVLNPIITMDSLIEGENAKDYLGTFDLVLQNPPFAGSLDKEAVNTKILTVTDTKKTELLFVTLMIELLKVGGRGMSVVPEGVLFGSSKAHLNLRKELVDHQKLIGVISMPSGVFMAPTAKGSSSKGAGVKTAYLIFQKTDNGGTDNVWFYNMENDGYTLDVKRTKIDGSDIPDIEYRFEHLEEEFKRNRSDKSFMVPVSEIIENNYDLSINKYRKVEREVVQYRSTSEILSDILDLNDKEEKVFSELKIMIGD